METGSFGDPTLLKIGGVASVILLGLLLSYSLKLYRYFKYHHKELKALGLFQETTKEFIDPKTKVVRQKVVKSRVRVFWRGSELVFSVYDRAKAIPDFERLKTHLEHIFQIKIEEIATEKPWLPWQQPRIVLYTESFKEALPFSESPKLEAGQFWLGRDGVGRNVVQDTIRDFENTLLILAGKGSGKSVAIRSVIQSFFEPFERVGRLQEFQLVIIDAKQTDFIDIAERYNALTFNPVFPEELQACVEYLEASKARIDNFRKFLQNEKISVAHWDELRGMDLSEQPPKKLVVVIDEAKQFLAVRDSIRVSKDSTDEERALKERFDNEKRLAYLINNIAEIQRPCGTILIISSQDSRSATYNFDFTNFKTILLGQQNDAQSRLLTGSDIAKDPTLKRGKFIYISESEPKKIQTPFSLAKAPERKGGQGV